MTHADTEFWCAYTGADIIKNDGIYSRYFFSFAVNGSYSVKVRVSHSPSTHILAHSIPGSHAMYVPGYIANGKHHDHFYLNNMILCVYL